MVVATVVDAAIGYNAQCKYADQTAFCIQFYDASFASTTLRIGGVVISYVCRDVCIDFCSVSYTRSTFRIGPAVGVALPGATGIVVGGGKLLLLLQ